MLSLLSVAIVLTVKFIPFYNRSEMQPANVKPPTMVDKQGDGQKRNDVITPPSTVVGKEMDKQAGNDVITLSNTEQLVVATEKTPTTNRLSEKAQGTQDNSENSENVALSMLMGFLGLKSFPDESMSVTAWDMRSIRSALSHYFQKFQKYPQGSHAEIMQVLEKEYLLSHSSSQRLNKKHEFMDPWGTPYEIHISPVGELRMKSAGPNKIFGDNDDKVLEAKLQ